MNNNKQRTCVVCGDHFVSKKTDDLEIQEDNFCCHAHRGEWLDVMKGIADAQEEQAQLTGT